MRNALAAPTATDRAVTQLATMMLVQILPSSSVSWNRPSRPEDSFPRNQSSVKPRQGGAGYGALLKANAATMTSGRNRKTRNAATYNMVAVRSQTGRASEAIMTGASHQQSAGRSGEVPGRRWQSIAQAAGSRTPRPVPN